MRPPKAAHHLAPDEEIAALTGKRHDNVMRDTRKMLIELHGEDLSKFGEISHDGYGREQPCFRLPKREAMVLLGRYSYKTGAVIVDRPSVSLMGVRNAVSVPRVPDKENPLKIEDVAPEIGFPRH